MKSARTPSAHWRRVATYQKRFIESFKTKFYLKNIKTSPQATIKIAEPTIFCRDVD
jgi:hypothetical protein